MGFLQVFKTWELLVEVLSQVENLLRNVQNLIFSHFADLDETIYDLRADKLLFLELFTNFQSYIYRANS